MRDRRPFPDVEESGPAPELVLGTDTLPELELPPGAQLISTPQHSPIQWHRAENRRMRRRAVATFAPKDQPAGLRRELLEKRQAKALGTLDVETRRLQRKALSK